MEQTIIVSDVDKKTRLDVYLAEVLDDWTRSQIKKQIDTGGALINGKVSRQEILFQVEIQFQFPLIASLGLKRFCQKILS